jgi:hypothetical protein
MSELRGKSHRDPTWVDRFVARPSRVEHLPYADPRNPWYAKWAKAQRQPRDRWWWRLRAQVLWTSVSLVTRSATYLRVVGELSQERARIGTRHRPPTDARSRHRSRLMTKSSTGAARRPGGVELS